MTLCLNRFRAALLLQALSLFLIACGGGKGAQSVDAGEADGDVLPGRGGAMPGVLTTPTDAAGMGTRPSGDAAPNQSADSASAPGTRPEAGVADGSAAVDVAGAPADAALEPVGLTAADVTAYAGQLVRLAAAAQPETAAFAWTLVKAPAGSTVTMAELAEPRSARPGLRPDVVGDYQLRVTATAPGRAPTNKEVRVSAVDAPVFFMEGRVAGANLSYRLRVAGAQTGAARDVGCIEMGAKSLATSFDLQPGYGFDVWEAPAGQPSRAAYAAVRLADGSGQHVLLAATSASSCTEAPPHLVSAAVVKDQDVRQPSFGPDGNRLAYLVYRSSTDIGVMTVAFDGTGARSLGTFGGTGDGAPARPQWKDATTIGWTRNSSDTAWEIVTAKDAAGATPAPFMSCAGSRPRQFAFLADGSVLVSKVGSPDALVVYRPDATRACQVVRTLTKLTNSTARARDFAISPDGAQIAFVQLADADVDELKGTVWGGFLAVAPMSGALPPQVIGTPPVRIDFGPRWVAGGSRLSVTRRMGMAQSAAVVPLTGSPVRELASADKGGDDLNVAATAGNGSACSLGGRGTAAGPLLLLGALSALALRRRRRG